MGECRDHRILLLAISMGSVSVRPIKTKSFVSENSADPLKSFILKSFHGFVHRSQRNSSPAAHFPPELCTAHTILEKTAGRMCADQLMKNPSARCPRIVTSSAM